VIRLLFAAFVVFVLVWVFRRWRLIRLNRAARVTRLGGDGLVGVGFRSPTGRRYGRGF
jgi:regulator of protease activity HflC (stomatin/prohibitin superfamily)